VGRKNHRMLPLRHGQPDGVLADLGGRGRTGSSRDTLPALYASWERHRDHIDYAQDKALGLPMGRGMVESAWKWLIPQRFKRVGMRWSEAGFNHLLPLRLAWVNGSFEALFPVQLQHTPTHNYAPRYAAESIHGSLMLRMNRHPNKKRS
jgi:hypothetical protein